MRKGLLIAALLVGPALAEASQTTLVLDPSPWGTPESVIFASTFTEWTERALPAQRLEDGRFSVTFEEPWMPEYEYKWILEPGDVWVPAQNLVREVPDFVPEPLAQPSAVSRRWRIQNLPLRRWDGRLQSVRVTVPPTSGPGKREPRPVRWVYFLDGDDYLAQAGALEILAHLSQRKVLYRGVFLPPVDRMGDYAFNDAFLDWIARDLVRAVEKSTQKTLQGAAAPRWIVGASLSGLAATHATLQHPEVFSSAISQSGSHWLRTDETLDMMTALSGPVRWILSVGSYETETMQDAFKAIAGAARSSASFEVQAHLDPSMHRWGSWKNGLVRGIRELEDFVLTK